MSTDTSSVDGVWSLASRAVATLALAALFVATTGAVQDMHDQPRFEPLEANPFFDDGMASRMPIEGTVARGQLNDDIAYLTGWGDNELLVASLPMEPTAELLQRGRERYDIFCSPCHGRLGDGKGMVVQRGFKEAPSFHQDRLRTQPVGYYVDAMVNGFGTMSSYRSMVPAHDRWAIAAYVKVLQYSQQVPVDDLSAADREALTQLGTGTTGPGH